MFYRGQSACIATFERCIVLELELELRDGGVWRNRHGSLRRRSNEQYEARYASDRMERFIPRDSSPRHRNLEVHFC